MEIADIIKRAGGCAKLSRELGLNHATVLGWKHVPPHRARDVARITGIPLHELRPDLWDAPEVAPIPPDAAPAADAEAA